MMTKKPKILAVVGPTASGKSALALALAKHYGGEIVCCDSMQIYKQMNIGTAKPTKEEMGEIPHHLFDFVDPKVCFSCAEYVARATEAVEEILSRGGLPVICGGTGLYLDRFLCGTDFEDTEIDVKFRKEMEAYAKEKGNEALHQLLRDADPESAEAIHPNNVKRVIRALEIYETSGRKKSELDRESKKNESRYDCVQIGIRYNDREALYSRIDRRVDKMLRDGLLEETKKLLDEGVFEANLTAAQAIGYKELLGHINGEKSFAQAVDELKRATRRYAKRQMTWFSAHGDVNWIYADDKSAEQIFCEATQIFIKK